MMTERKSAVTAQLIARGMSPEKAVQKFHAWRVGILVAVLGGMLALVSFAIVVLPIVLLRQMPDKWLLGFAGVGFMGGFFLVFVGAHAASGEAMDAAGESGGRLLGAIAKAVRVARTKNGGTT